jgi:hypothetical protein
VQVFYVWLSAAAAATPVQSELSQLLELLLRLLQHLLRLPLHCLQV